MKIYVLWEPDNCDGDSLIGIFSTREKAEVGKARRNSRGDYISEHELDEFLTDEIDSITRRSIMAKV
jgi:hypothetical protein